MDKERAKFVLQSFRPDGLDAKDADFAKALQLATKDRELGEWLVRERAFDAEFAKALARVELPKGLRESVLLAMVQDAGDFPKVDMKEEGKWMDALGSIEVPSGLRERVLEAMEHTASVQPMPFQWRRLAVPLAAVAGIMVALLLSRNEDAKGLEPTMVGLEKVQVDAVQASFVQAIKSPAFTLEKRSSEVPTLVSYLQDKGLPCGQGLLPPGLKACQGVGCRELEIDGKSGTLICFNDDEGEVHLVIFRRSDIEGDFPGMDHPVIEKVGEWAKATWENGNFVFSLMGQRETDQLAGLF